MLYGKVLFHLGECLPLFFLTGDLRVLDVLTVLKLFDELLVKLDRKHDLYTFPLFIDDKARYKRSGRPRRFARFAGLSAQLSLSRLMTRKLGAFGPRR